MRAPFRGEVQEGKHAAPAGFAVPDTRTKTTLHFLEQSGRPTWDDFEPLRETPEEDVDSQWKEEEAQLKFYAMKFRLPSGRKYRVARKPKNVRQRFEEHRADVERIAEVAGLENLW